MGLKYCSGIRQRKFAIWELFTLNEYYLDSFYGVQ